MAETTVAETTVAEVMAELAALEDPKAREVNEKHGDDHGVNLGKLRALAKRLKTQQELARQLWETDDTAARLLAILICRPKAFERDELDVMLREARTPKVHDWLVNYVVKKNPHAEELRLAWSADPDPVVASAGWALTTERVAKKPEGLDLAGLLDVIEAEMKDAPDRLQWAMNHCLAQIGIEHAEHRARAIDIGERLEVLKDYPTPPNCTSPFAPIWITEMVRRQQATLRDRRAHGRPAAHRAGDARSGTTRSPNTAAPLARILQQNGFSTAQIDKCHEVPVWETSPMGPYRQWPVGLGFEYLYGFLGGETNQWYPALYEGTTPVEPPKTPRRATTSTTTRRRARPAPDSGYSAGPAMQRAAT